MSTIIRDEAEHTRLLEFYRDRVADQELQSPGYGARWCAWCRQVLTHGGDLVVPPPTIEEDLDRLSGAAEAHDGTTARLRLGRPNQCQALCTNLALKFA